ncbi:hypothetical protein [Pseudogulbenkiania sp. MAI-1]|uniref:hypothetical protein n=1 Tax=Pseudogulbenkiania sp. MAI-1 TaxID=990370 RepID=UPI00045EBF1E|nr:hypothetical protein [Pseudogulbenkiania sp. MAI-1]
MTRQEARNILQSLAHGINPASGEVLSNQSPFNQPDVIRALFVAGEALVEAEKRQRKEASSDSHAGQPWSEEEESRVKAAFAEGKSIVEIAALHQRSRGAITARLARLGLIS